MSHGEEYLNPKIIVVRVVCESGFQLTIERDICFANCVGNDIYFFIILNVLFLLTLGSFVQFIRLFYFTHQSIVLSTKVSFHFHLYITIICISQPSVCINIKPLSHLAFIFHFPP